MISPPSVMAEAPILAARLAALLPDAFEEGEDGLGELRGGWFVVGGQAAVGEQVPATGVNEQLGPRGGLDEGAGGVDVSFPGEEQKDRLTMCASPYTARTLPSGSLAGPATRQPRRIRLMGIICHPNRRRHVWGKHIGWSEYCTTWGRIVRMVDQSPGLAEPALVELAPDLPGTDSLTVRISRKYADDLVELLESHQLRYSKVVYASGGPNLAIYAVYSAAGALVGLGGFSGLAKVLTAFFNRHQGKRFVVNGDEISAEGVSLKDAQHWIELVLEKQAELEARRAAPPASSTTQPRTPLGPPP